MTALELIRKMQRDEKERQLRAEELAVRGLAYFDRVAALDPDTLTVTDAVRLGQELARLEADGARLKAEEAAASAWWRELAESMAKP